MLCTFFHARVILSGMKPRRSQVVARLAMFRFWAPCGGKEPSNKSAFEVDSEERLFLQEHVTFLAMETLLEADHLDFQAGRHPSH